MPQAAKTLPAAIGEKMKLLKKISACAAALVLLSLSVLNGFAETRYYENGYYYSFINNDAVALVGWDQRTPVLAVPAELNYRAVTSVGDNAFSDDETLTGIDFSNAVNLRAIRMYSFANCVNLSQKLVLPQSIVFIDDCAFEGCTSIPEVEIDSDLYYIPAQCFNKCASLESAALNDGLEQILRFAFANCPELNSVNIPASVTYIDDTAFYNSPNLTLGVWYDSYAYHYAAEKNIPYTLLDGVKLGDVDGNGIVNINDVTEIQRYLAELDVLEGISLYASDANRDGVLDISDATAIQMYLAEYEIEYPIGEIITQ